MSTTGYRGYGFGGYGAGRYGDSKDEDETMTCQGTKTNGDPCSLPAGWGTDSDTYCMYHVNQADNTNDTDSNTDTMTNESVIYAATAADIQPAIDKLATTRDDNGARGGVVQLEAKTYYPETTIWLKSGVTLQGARQTRSAGNRRCPHIGGKNADEPIRSTVISTAQMTEGAGAYTFEHARANPHPHFPVIANYQAHPVVDGEPQTLDNSVEEYDEWGADIGLRNLVIEADKQRYWDYATHGADDIYNGGRDIDGVDMSDEDWATYFGVYDACIFEATRNVLAENVETRGFLGYGALFKDADPVLDRGSKWGGGASDYHGAALKLDHDAESHSWTRGTWDVEASGPAPTVVLNGYTQSNFVSGGWSDAHIQGHEREFLGDEARFWDGNVPLVSQAAAESVVYYQHSNTLVDGYSIEGPGRGGDAEATYDGFLIESPGTFHNCSVNRARSAFVSSKGNPIRIDNCGAFKCDSGIEFAGVQPLVSNFVLDQCGSALKFRHGRSHRQGSLTGITMRDVDYFIEPGQHIKRSLVVNLPDFQEVGSFGEDSEYVTINVPIGYEGVSDFPERHKP